MGAQQDRGGEIFLEWCLHCLGTVTAPVQGFAGEIEADRGLVAQQIDIDADIGLGRIDGGAHAEFIAQLVYHGVFSLQRAVVRVGDGRLRGGEVHGQRPCSVEMFLPGNGFYPGVQIFRCGRRETCQRQENATGQPRPQAGAIADGEWALKRHTGTGFLDHFGAELAQLVGEQRFDALGTGGEKLACVGHGLGRMLRARSFPVNNQG